jgi:hypothetical protein
MPQEIEITFDDRRFAVLKHRNDAALISPESEHRPPVIESAVSSIATLAYFAGVDVVPGRRFRVTFTRIP